MGTRKADRHLWVDSNPNRERRSSVFVLNKLPPHRSHSSETQIVGEVLSDALSSAWRKLCKLVRLEPSSLRKFAMFLYVDGIGEGVCSHCEQRANVVTIHHRRFANSQVASAECIKVCQNCVEVYCSNRAEAMADGLHQAICKSAPQQHAKC